MFSEYQTKMGSSVKVISAFFIAAFTISTATFLNYQPIDSWGVPALLVFTPSAFLLIMWLRRVVSYKVFNDKILIQRGLSTKEYSLSKLVELSHPSISFFKLRKIWGNGGLFSFTGIYSYKKLGRFDCFVTDWDKAIFIESEDFKVMVSPENTEEFLDDVAAKLNKKR